MIQNYWMSIRTDYMNKTNVTYFTNYYIIQADEIQTNRTTCSERAPQLLQAGTEALCPWK